MEGRPAKNLDAAEGMFFAAGQGHLMSKEQFAVDRFQVRFQFGQMPVENDGFLAAGDLQAALVAPAHQPLQQFQAGQNQ